MTTVVNAQGRYTTLGGSVMADEVMLPMAAAARSYVNLFAPQKRAARGSRS